MDDIKIIESGDEFFVTLWDLIDNSKERCWIINYHIGKNLITDETMIRLTRAVDRGVNVVIYVDWLSSSLSKRLRLKLKERGVRIEKTHPIKSTLLSYFTGRTFEHRIAARDIFERYHQKLILVDNKVIVGSANFAAEYAGHKLGDNSFYDLNLVITDKCVDEAVQVFRSIADRFQYKSVDILSDYIKGQRVKNQKIIEEVTRENENNEINNPKILSDPDADEWNPHLVASEPFYFNWTFQETLLELIENAQSKVIITNGYYYNIKKVTKALERAVTRGVNVSLFTSKKRDQLVYSLFSNSFLTKDLYKAGASIYELPEDRTLHMKSYVIDDHVIVGSSNCDRWSWSMNNEMNVYIQNKNFTEKVCGIINRPSLNYQLVEEKMTFRTRFAEFFWTRFLHISELFMNQKKELKCFLPQAFIHVEHDPVEERFLMKRKKVKQLTTSTFKLSFYNS